jgi:hypothetical protein
MEANDEAKQAEKADQLRRIRKQRQKKLQQRPSRKPASTKDEAEAAAPQDKSQSSKKIKAKTLQA